MPVRNHTLVRLLLLTSLFLVMIIGALLLADEVSQSENLQAAIRSYGYVSVLILAIVTGVNVIVPIPAATFVPVFLEAGLSYPIIILCLTLGTTMGDFIGFAFGSIGRVHVSHKYPRLIARIEHIIHHNHTWVIPLIILYAALAPFPNEIIVIPLALAGYKAKSLLWPLLVGNFINHTVLAYGFVSAFVVLFSS